VRGDEETPLFRDRDGSILLLRLPGDRWTVCKCQSDADWIRGTECSGALTGLTMDGVSFLRVVPLSEVREALLSGEMAEYVADWSHAHADEAHQAMEGAVEALEDPAFKFALAFTDSERREPK
jgi:hypothetical protein